jgi:hypothetical protein
VFRSRYLANSLHRRNRQAIRMAVDGAADPVNYRDPRGLCVVPTEEGLAISDTCYEEVGIDNNDPAQGVPRGSSHGSGEPSPWDFIRDAAFKASDRLFNPECAGLFLAPEANTLEQRRVLSQQLQYATDLGRIRPINASALPAGTGPSVPGFTTGTLGLIYFVEGGAFFTNKLDGKPLGGALSGLTLSETQQLMVIHELLHWLGVGPDNADQKHTFPNGATVVGSAGISAEVRKRCFQ